VTAHTSTTDRGEVSDINRLVKEINGWDTFSLERDLFWSAGYLKNLNRVRMPRSEKIESTHMPPSCSSTTNDVLECQPMSRRFAFPAIPM
jgi:hypothetical protein